MRSSYPQTYEPNHFPELDILKLAYKMIEICLKIKDALKFDGSKAFQCKKAMHGRLVQP